MVDVAGYCMLPNQSIGKHLSQRSTWTEARSNMAAANQGAGRRNFGVAQSEIRVAGLTNGQIITSNDRLTTTRPNPDAAYALAAPDDYTAATSLLGNIAWPEANLQQHRPYNHSYTQASGTWQAQSAVNAATNQSDFTASLTPTQLPLSRTTSRVFPPSIQITDSTSAYIIRPQDSRSDSQFRSYPPQNLLTPNIYAMSLEQPQQPVSDIPVQHAPVSPVSHHSGVASRGQTPVYQDPSRIGIEPGRKRSFSQIDHQLQGSPHESHASLNATSPGGMYAEDGQSVQRITKTIKRPEAPMNAEHKYICDVSADCAELVFDRKCEWSKHMDKHDRPYRCPHPSCAKLQGFTYSGGLLRHEREVHNKHGGPRAFLMCPHPTCKRHTDKGFTRKENLQEHLRRVHAGKEDPNRTSDAGATNVDTEMTTPGDRDEFYNTLNNKEPTDAERAEIAELRAQLQQVRTASEAKDALILQLEQDAQSRTQRIIQLEDALQQMQR